MSDTVKIALIAGIFSLSGIILPLIVSFFLKQLTNKIDGYHKEVDGKMTQLLEVTGTAKKAEGKEEQRLEQVQEKKTATDTDKK